MPVRFARLQTLSALFLVMFLAHATALFAQKDAGAIVGLVRDPSDAVMTNAKVTVADPNNINTPANPQASTFGYPLAARAPRQIQFALKFYF